MDKIPMTAGGHAKLEAELKQLKSVERPAIIDAIAEAREHGDLSENAEYHAAREKQGLLEGRISELEDVLSRAEVINIAALSGEEVKFGATVTLVDEETEEQKVYQLVGEYESNSKLNRISIASPLARGLIGKVPGASIEVHTPKGTKYYELLSVAFK